MASRRPLSPDPLSSQDAMGQTRAEGFERKPQSALMSWGTQKWILALRRGQFPEQGAGSVPEGL